MPDMPFAYAIAHAESSWTWSVFDIDGVTVAEGVQTSQSEALDAVQDSIQSAARRFG